MAFSSDLPQKIEEIEHVRLSFIAAAIYAQKAGFDGVELHGAHGYLLNQFANSLINKREEARSARNWKEADSYRERLAEMGIDVLDTPQGVVWRFR